MDFQDFTLKEFKKLKQLKEFFDYSVQDKDELYLRLEQLENKLKQRKKYVFSSILRTKIKEKEICFIDRKNINSLEDDYVIRKMAANLKRIYKIKQIDRNKIIKQVKNLLSEKGDYYIYRLDIKDFFESISIKDLNEKFNNSFLISNRTKELLHCFFKQCCFNNRIPRGTSISSVLSEIYLRNFDQEIKRLDGVFYFARFVDDIIIFITEQKSIKFFEDILRKSTSLSLNLQKTKEIILEKKSSYPVEFDYLGYKFVINSDRKFSIGISEKKIKKIKSKIIYSFLDYEKNINLINAKSLLEKRILFLTCSYSIKTERQQISSYRNTSKLHAGLKYGYPYLDDENKSLKSLDNFLKKIIFQSKFSSILDKNLKSRLKKYSFQIGYDRKITRNFHKDLRAITRCWKYVQ